MSKINRLMVGIFIAIVGIRIMLVFHGYPTSWHPDEWRIVLETLSMAQTKSLIPTNINYPLFFKYLLLLIYGFWYIIGRIFNIFSSSWDFAILFFKSPEIFLMVPRLVNAVLGILTIGIGYKVAKRYFNQKAAIISALFLGLEYQLLAHSVYGLHQIAAAITTLPVFYCVHKYIYDSSKRNSITLGLAVGLAMSTHQTNILFLPPLAYLFISQFFIEKKVNLPNLITFTFVSISTSLLGNLFWIVNFQESLKFFTLGNEVSKIAFSSHQVFTYTIPSFILWFAREVIKQDLLIGIFMLLGVGFALARRKREDWFFIIFLTTYTLFFYSWAFRWLHLLIGIFPILCIYGAKSASVATEKLPKRNVVKVLVATIFIVSCAISLKGIFIESCKLDSRSVAKEWVEKNIGTDKKIAIDWAAYNINLQSSLPIFLRNPVGRDYFDKNIPESIKKTISTDNNYSIVEAMYSTPSPIWPKNMPEEKIKIASNSAVFRNLYSYYNFLNFDQLSDQTDYLVISSYSYDMFLLDSDARKNNPFNPYLKDDIHSFQSHIDDNGDETKNGLLSYLAKRGRDFYLPLLNNSDSRFIEIKRLEPNNNISGPTIIIYKINR